MNLAPPAGYSPMLLACEQGYAECAQMLSSFGASRNILLDGHEFTAESEAADEGHEELRAWLERSRDWTPLHHIEVLTPARTRALLRAGADPNAVAADEDGAELRPVDLLCQDDDDRRSSSAGADADCRAQLLQLLGPAREAAVHLQASRGGALEVHLPLVVVGRLLKLLVFLDGTVVPQPWRLAFLLVLAAAPQPAHDGADAGQADRRANCSNGGGGVSDVGSSAGRPTAAEPAGRSPR